MKIFFCICVSLFSASGCVFAQTTKKNISQLPPAKIEPFKIEPGSSFSASPARENQNSVMAKNEIEMSREAVSEDFSDALDIIRNNHIDGDKIPLDDLTKSSLTAMLRALDPHSNYYDARDYQALLSDEQSEYSGIGVSIANFTRDGRADIYVTSTFPDSPAFRAGLRFGDKIVAVGGENMAGKSSLYARGKIRGVKDSIAKLSIERGASGRIENIEIRRATVPQPSIPDAYVLRSGIGYIDLTGGFNYTTADEFNRALKDLHEQGMTSLVMDLRDNPGGIVEQAVKIAEKFLPAGQTILTQRGRVEIDNRNWKSFNKNPENISLVVLVNGGSASASEIVTGALQDSDRALIVGEKTFGKGLVQSVLNLPYNAGLTLTTAKYYTPSGRSIQRDYSQGNLYDYFRHRVSYNPSPNQLPSKTFTGRNVYGGDGILPDEIVKNPQITQSQMMLFDPIFFFARELANGRVKGFEDYKISSPVQSRRRIKPSDFPVGEEILNSFKNYLNKEKFVFSDKQFEANRKFIAARLRYDLATAAFGSVAANQVMIENDLQVAKAIDALPRAQNLLIAARRISQRK
ncbi:MAG: S41 family peptidase [Pyrinomonadaceae bacterium]